MNNMKYLTKQEYDLKKYKNKFYDGFINNKRIEMNNVFLKGHWDIEIEANDENNNIVHLISRKGKDRISINFSSKKDVMNFLDICEAENNLDEFSNGRFIDKTNIIKTINNNKGTIAALGIIGYICYRILKNKKGAK